MAVTQTGRGTSTGTDSKDKDMVVKAAFYDLSAQAGLTATAGGAQAGVPLAYQICQFSTVASAADSCQLPAAKAGRWRIVMNGAAANAMAIFPQTGETINALGANNAFSLAANKVVTITCAVDGAWATNLTA